MRSSGVAPSDNLLYSSQARAQRILAARKSSFPAIKAIRRVEVHFLAMLLSMAGLTDAWVSMALVLAGIFRSRSACASPNAILMLCSGSRQISIKLLIQLLHFTPPNIALGKLGDETCRYGMAWCVVVCNMQLARCEVGSESRIIQVACLEAHVVGRKRGLSGKIHLAPAKSGENRI